jgi:NCS1 family nucleobase:cation symporter-1
MEPADLSPVPDAARTQSPFDLFLIFAAANVVATTLQTGAVLGAAFGTADVMALVVSGAVFGAVLVAALAPVGSRSGVPSMIAARAPLGHRGASLVAALLYLTNFAWIAVNNSMAASACARVFGGAAATRGWSAGLGVLATAIVSRGPRAVAHADRVAVPLMLVAGGMLTWAVLSQGPPPPGDASAAAPPVWWGLDVIVGYQVSWLLMFADYSRYTRSPRASGAAVFAGLALPALWLMPVGWMLARLAGSDDPGTMLAAAGTGAATALLVATATVTTNFVNIYLSSLAWRSLVPRAPGAASVWAIGLIGTALGLLTTEWLTRFADLMILIASVLVPAGGVFLAHFVVLRRPIDLAAVYAPAAGREWNTAGLAAWLAGGIVYQVASPIGATLPTLATAVGVYIVLGARQRRRGSG